ncbi:hypothetical protein PoB_001027800 [Plakobranchus ocellatus]|uniref:Uncharacterized protein n=1 Tax=Plakobranchus ocellatus TaxID=259542 RepID=A0AAV3YN48_9GAST|nr:hypothetical protein PoB_001027800 [Plakobranchus ocellatus]
MHSPMFKSGNLKAVIVKQSQRMRAHFAGHEVWENNLTCLRGGYRGKVVPQVKLPRLRRGGRSPPGNTYKHVLQQCDNKHVLLNTRPAMTSILGGGSHVIRTSLAPDSPLFISQRALGIWKTGHAPSLRSPPKAWGNPGWVAM